jgi:hypothetical protein
MRGMVERAIAITVVIGAMMALNHIVEWAGEAMKDYDRYPLSVYDLKR